jgi:GTPase SAR1 family protein
MLLEDSRFVHFLRRVGRLFAGSPDPEALSLAGEADRIVRRLEEPLRIAVAGPYNAGKSTLVNALLKAEVVPTDVVRETVTVNRLVYGADTSLLVRYKNDRTPPESISCHSRSLVSTLKRIAAKGAAEIESIDVLYPLEQLRRFTIIDTPGLDFDEQDTRSALVAVEQADLIIWLTQYYYKNEHEWLSELRKRCDAAPQAVCLVNYIDIYTPEEATELMEDVQARGQGQFDAVFPVSAAQAFSSIQRNDPALYDRSRFGPFAAWLSQDVLEKHDERLSAKVRTLAQGFGKRAEEVLDDGIANLRERQRSIETSASSIVERLDRELTESCADAWKLFAQLLEQLEPEASPLDPGSNGKRDSDPLALLSELQTELGVNSFVKKVDTHAQRFGNHLKHRCENEARAQPEFRQALEGLSLYFQTLGPMEALSLYLLGAGEQMGVGRLAGTLRENELLRSRIERLNGHLLAEYRSMVERALEQAKGALLHETQTKLDHYTALRNALEAETPYFLEEVDG